MQRKHRELHHVLCHLVERGFPFVSVVSQHPASGAPTLPRIKVARARLRLRIQGLKPSHNVRNRSRIPLLQESCGYAPWDGQLCLRIFVLVVRIGAEKLARSEHHAIERNFDRVSLLYGPQAAHAAPAGIPVQIARRGKNSAARYGDNRLARCDLR